MCIRDSEKDKKNVNKSEAPKTGDTNSTAIWMMLMFISATGLISVYGINKKKR